MHKEMIKPYGDTLNDGMVQLAFTLPVPNGARAKKAAEQYVSKLQFTDISVSFSQEIAENFTYFVVYGKAVPEIDYCEIEATEAKVEQLEPLIDHLLYHVLHLLRVHRLPDNCRCVIQRCRLDNDAWQCFQSLILIVSFNLCL